MKNDYCLKYFLNLNEAIKIIKSYITILNVFCLCYKIKKNSL